jgi:hypothetical protein
MDCADRLPAYIALLDCQDDHALSQGKAHPYVGRILGTAEMAAYPQEVVQIRAEKRQSEPFADTASLSATQPQASSKKRSFLKLSPDPRPRPGFAHLSVFQNSYRNQRFPTFILSRALKQER